MPEAHFLSVEGWVSPSSPGLPSPHLWPLPEFAFLPCFGSSDLLAPLSSPKLPPQGAWLAQFVEHAALDLGVVTHVGCGEDLKIKSLKKKTTKLFLFISVTGRGRAAFPRAGSSWPCLGRWYPRRSFAWAWAPSERVRRWSVGASALGCLVPCPHAGKGSEPLLPALTLPSRVSLQVTGLRTARRPTRG